MNNLVDIFGEKINYQTITDIADASLPSICHKFSLPCSSKQCMTPDILSTVMVSRLNIEFSLFRKHYLFRQMQIGYIASVIWVQMAEKTEQNCLSIHL